MPNLADIARDYVARHNAECHKYGDLDATIVLHEQDKTKLITRYETPVVSDEDDGVPFGDYNACSIVVRGESWHFVEHVSAVPLAVARAAFGA